MDTINKKYNIEITVLSPLSIGAGAEKDWVRGIDFVVKDNKIHLLNLKKMVQNGIAPQDLTTFYAEKKDGSILEKIRGKLDKISDRIMDLPVNSDNNIKSFIKNELTNKPIIPGSSLKGAVRSVILEYLLQGYKPNLLKEKEYFGDSSKGDELMRFIKFSDAEFEDTALVNTKIFNLRQTADGWLGGWKYSSRQTVEKFQPTGFNTLYEAISPNKKGVCSIMVSDIGLFNVIEKETTKELRNRIEEDKRKFKDEDLKKDTRILKIKEDVLQKKENLFSINELFNIINGHTYNYIGKEIDFFEKYNQAENVGKIINSLTNISNQIPDEDDDVKSCILKMAAGSGFHSITGDWQYEDFSETGIWTNGRNAGKQKYKSRKVAIHEGIFSLMGFVKLRIMPDDK